MTSNEDTILFGSSADHISDDFGDCVDAALTEGVHSLPMMQPSSSAMMLASLRKEYHRNVDIFQGYIHRNVCSIGGLSKLRRTKIVQAFLDNNSNSVDEDAAAPLSDLTNTITTNEAPKYPSKEDVPTKADMAAIDDALASLRTQLTFAKRRRTILQTKLDQLGDADHVAQHVATVVTTEKVHSAVSIMVQGHETLTRLTDQAMDSLEALANDKRQRSEEDDDEVPKQEKLSLEAQYEQDRKRMATEDIQKFKELIHKEKQ